MNEQMTRTVPTPLKVIAWMWILSAFLVAVTEVAGVLVHSALEQMRSQGLELPPALLDLASSATAFGALDVLQIVLAVVMLWGGIELLRLKAWARTAIEGVTWLTLLYTLVRGAQMTLEWKSASLPTGAAGLPGAGDGLLQIDPHMLQTVGVVTGIALTLVFCAPLVLIIRYLRGAEARAATSPAKRPPPKRK